MENLFQTLTNTDQALYIRIKVIHPLWSDELVEKEIKNLQSKEFAEGLQELLNANLNN